LRQTEVTSERLDLAVLFSSLDGVNTEAKKAEAGQYSRAIETSRMI
jgi:hypothetical protein